MPKSRPGGANASPESFSRTRRYSWRPGTVPAAATEGSAASPVAASRPMVTRSPSGVVLAPLEAHEPADDDVLAQPGLLLGDPLPDGLLPGQVAEERLIQEAAL